MSSCDKILMMKFRILLLRNIDSLWLVVVLSLYMHLGVWAAPYMDNIEIRFQQFIVEYNRTYSINGTEYTKRLAIFAVSPASCVSAA